MSSNDKQLNQLSSLTENGAVKQLGVTLRGRRVGTLAQTPDGLAAFEYDSQWLSDGFSISPLSLPLRSGVFVPNLHPFNGVFGVFQDSLPDGWGALLLNRLLKNSGIDPAEVTPMTMLSLVGSGGRGALCYEPEIITGDSAAIDDFDAFSKLCQEILADKPVDDLDEAFAAGGSSAGARPKAYVKREGSEWLVKFPSSMDPDEIGVMEYEYSRAAKECGIAMSRTELLPSKICGGFFATERFDRNSAGEGVHMITASGLLEVSHRFPALDYKHLFQATQMLTRDLSQAWQVFRLMCFNVFAHNQDDHSNNFAWLCEEGEWGFSPAYDLTYSTSFGGEHATTVNGRGKPTMDGILALSSEVGLPSRKAKVAVQEVQARCNELLKSLGLS